MSYYERIRAMPRTKPVTTSLRVIGYCRVSTTQQEEDGISLAAQQAKIAQYTELYGLELVETIVESASAKTLERPGLQEALTMLRSGKADGIIVCKLDRMTRSVRDLGTLIAEYFEKHQLMSIEEKIDTSSASGRLILNVLISVSQWEREVIGERTRAAMTFKRSIQQRTSYEAPYGYTIADDGKTLLPHTTEQALIQAVRDAREDGLSYRQVVARLHAQGHRTRKGTTITLTQLQRIMEYNNIA